MMSDDYKPLPKAGTEAEKLLRDLFFMQDLSSMNSKLYEIEEYLNPLLDANLKFPDEREDWDNGVL